MNGLVAGLLMVLAGGAMQGSFALPQKHVKGWAWEKNWLFYSVFGMIVIPWLLVAMLIPNPAGVYSAVPGTVLLDTALFGMGWGIGSVLFGLGIARVGIALAFALIISLTAVVGTLVPMIVLHPGELGSAKGAYVIAGLLIVIVGVVVCARAGAMKDAAASAASKTQGGFTTGLLICIASGLMSPMMNLGFAFGAPISVEAVRRGAGPGSASISIFAVAIGAGFVINAAYCLYLLARNGTWGSTVSGVRLKNVLYSFCMGFLWLFGFFLYGLGATDLKDLGPILGWPLLMTSMVLVANFWGLATGEWKDAGPRAKRMLGMGTAIMIVAMVVTSLALWA
jgi:L-rhamnose-H+ transport protein